MAVDRRVEELRRVEREAAEKAIRPAARPIPRVAISTTPRAGTKPYAELIFELHLRQLERLVAQKGQAGLRSMYENAIAELRRRMAMAPKDPTRATPTEIAALIAQAEAVLASFGKDFERHMQDVGKTAASMGAKHAVDEYRRISEHFKGMTPVLSLERGAVLEGLVDTADQSLLRRYRNVTQTWTLSAISEMERRLSVGTMTGKSWFDLTEDIAGQEGLLEAERYKAERIVRTELHHAHGATKFAAMRRTRDDVGEANLWKKLVATFDDRTGDDSFLVHGQAVPLERPFEWKHRVRGTWVVSPYMHPPNRPNDREVVIPWDPAWDEMKGFEAPLTRAELLAARPTRWRKTIGVKIPPGHKPGQPYSYKVARPAPEDEEAPPPREGAARAEETKKRGLDAEARAAAEAEAKAKLETERKLEAERLLREERARAAAEATQKAEAARKAEEARKAPERTLDVFRKGEAVSYRRLGGGANDSQIVAIQDAKTGQVREGVWKPKTGEKNLRGQSIPEGTFYRREAATYELDKLLGGEPTVPPTTIRKDKPTGQLGSVQDFARDAFRADHKDIKADFDAAQASGAIDTNPKVRRMVLLDLVAGNTDRHDGNVLWRRTGPGQVEPVAIDNGLAMPKTAHSAPFRAPTVIDLHYVVGTFGPAEKALLEKVDLSATAKKMAELGIERDATSGVLHRLVSLREDPTRIRQATDAIPTTWFGPHDRAEHVATQFFRDSLDAPDSLVSSYKGLEPIYTALDEAYPPKKKRRP